MATDERDGPSDDPDAPGARDSSPESGHPESSRKGPLATLGKTLFHVRSALKSVLASEARTEPLEQRAPGEPSPVLPVREPREQRPGLTSVPAGAADNGRLAGGAHGEFDEFLGALGAQASDTSAVERKDREIGELRRMLEMLRPIGDELARVEQQRLAEKAAHEREVADLRLQVAAGRSSQEAAVALQIEAVLGSIAELESTAVEPVQAPTAAELSGATEPAASADSGKADELERALEESRAEVCRLSGCLADLTQELARRVKALDRSEEARKSLRGRFEERKRLASERWHELRLLKQRLRELERGGA